MISRRSFCFSALAARLSGQQGTVFTTDVQVVNLFATVRNREGQIVSDLTKDDFVLEEDGRPQAIRYFARETDLPLTLGLLIDTSGSQRRVLDDERRAGFRFLDRVLREDQDRAFIIQFEGEVELLRDLTSSRSKLESAMTLMGMPIIEPRWRDRRPRGGTSLYDAVLLASDELMRKQSGRKALILMSDGVDTSSKVGLPESMEAAQRADTLVYSVYFYDEQAYGGLQGFSRRGSRGRRQVAPRDGKGILERISKETGAGVFEVSRRLPMDRIFDQIEEELRNQYSLGYTPDESQNSGFRRISLSTKSKRLTVRTREGYYAGT
jgi:VWFA-related protein